MKKILFLLSLVLTSCTKEYVETLNKRLRDDTARVNIDSIRVAEEDSIKHLIREQLKRDSIEDSEGKITSRNLRIEGSFYFSQFDSAKCYGTYELNIINSSHYQVDQLQIKVSQINNFADGTTKSSFIQDQGYTKINDDLYENRSMWITPKVVGNIRPGEVVTVRGDLFKDEDNYYLDISNFNRTPIYSTLMVEVKNLSSENSYDSKMKFFDTMREWKTFQNQINY